MIQAKKKNVIGATTPTIQTGTMQVDWVKVFTSN